MTGTELYSILDPFLIWIFRIPSQAWLGFVFGITWICLLTTVIGELSMAGAYFINKRHFAGNSHDMVQNHNLSVQALGCKNKEAWKACNQLANDAFGKNFFSHIALFASSLWPVPFAIGWLYYRFSGVNFSVPFAGEVGPSFIFIPSYILFRYLFGKLKPWIPVFRTIKRKIKENEDAGGTMLSYADLMQDSKKKQAEQAG